MFAVGYESYFRLPSGVKDQDYVTLLRREADSGRSSAIRLSDVADIVGLVPEVTWAYAGSSPVSMTHRGGDGSSEVVSSRYVSPNYLELLGVAPRVGAWEPRSMAPRWPLSAIRCGNGSMGLTSTWLAGLLLRTSGDPCRSLAWSHMVSLGCFSRRRTFGSLEARPWSSPLATPARTRPARSRAP